jgi:hypothetical protein
MSSNINDRTNFEPEPLYPGHYYLVDCSNVIAEFMEVPTEVRMHMAAGCDELSEYDMVDVELTELVDCLVLKNPIDHLDYHIESVLDEGRDVLRQEAIDQGVHKEGRAYANTPVQIEHADALLQLGTSLSKVLKQFGFYDSDGHLTVEYHQLLPGGLVAFRKAETSFT